MKHPWSTAGRHGMRHRPVLRARHLAPVRRSFIQGRQDGGRWRQALGWQCRRSAVRAATWLASMLAPFAAQAQMPAFPLWAAPQIQWSEPASAQVWGMPLHYLRFTTAWSLERMAAELSRDALRFQTFTRLPDRLLLSGHTQDQHWMAQLVADGSGSRGMVSVLQAISTAAPGRAADPGGLAGMLPSSSLWRALLHVRRNQEGRIVEQAVYQVKAAWPAMLAELQRRLREAGWEPAGGAEPQGEVWRRAGQRLRWQSRAQAGQLMLFVHYSE